MPPRRRLAPSRQQSRPAVVVSASPQPTARRAAGPRGGAMQSAGLTEAAAFSGAVTHCNTKNKNISLHQIPPTLLAGGVSVWWGPASRRSKLIYHQLFYS